MDMTKPQWRAGVNQALGAYWTPYAPLLSASTTSPAGWVTTGAWYRVGALVVARFRLTAGASMTAGSGTYRVGLPVDATFDEQMTIGSAELYDSSTGNVWMGYCSLRTATYLQVGYGTGTGAPFAAAGTPWTWAAGDVINGTVTYETAAP